MNRVPESFKEAIREKVTAMSAVATVEFREEEKETTISIQENGREVYQTVIDSNAPATSYAAMLLDGLIIGLRLCVYNDKNDVTGFGRVLVKFLDNWELCSGEEAFGTGQVIPAGEHWMIRRPSPMPERTEAPWLMLEGTNIGQTERSFVGSGRVEILFEGADTFRQLVEVSAPVDSEELRNRLTHTQLMAEIERQRNWIMEHGKTLENYIDRYGDPGLAKCYGDGGTKIYAADMGALEKLIAEYNKRFPAVPLVIDNWPEEL